MKIGRLQITLQSHWKCWARGSGHAILLGFEFGLVGDYGFRKEPWVAPCLLGFAVEFKWLESNPPRKENPIEELGVTPPRGLGLNMLEAMNGSDANWAAALAAARKLDKEIAAQENLRTARDPLNETRLSRGPLRALGFSGDDDATETFAD